MPHVQSDHRRPLRAAAKAIPRRLRQPRQSSSSVRTLGTFAAPRQARDGLKVTENAPLSVTLVTLGADRGLGVGAGRAGALGEIVGQLGVPGPGLLGNCALGFHPLFNRPSGIITRVRLHDASPPVRGPDKGRRQGHLGLNWLTNGYYPQGSRRLSRRGTSCVPGVTANGRKRIIDETERLAARCSSKCFKGNDHA